MDLSIKKIDTDKHKCKVRHLMHLGIIPSAPEIVLFVGAAGSGKSNLITNLILRPEFYGRSTEL